MFFMGMGNLLSHHLSTMKSSHRLFDPRTGTLKQDLTVSEYKALVMSHIDKISKKGEEYSRVKEVSVQRCIDDYKKNVEAKKNL